MGVHICFFKKIGKDFINADDEVFGAINENELREGGDTEFSYNMEYRVMRTECPNIGESVYRPRFFDEARWHVKNNEHTNRDRFFKILDYLEANPDIYIWISC